MIELTPAAREQLDRYIDSTRSALRGTRMPVEEIESNVREHVEVALAGVPGPVSADDIRTVLERLGPPDRWLMDDDKPSWRRMMDRLRSGPEDWRLAYVAFALFTVSVVFFPFGGFMLLIPSYLLSRGYVEYVRGRGEDMGARRWLILPPIALVLMFFAAAVLIAPIAGFLAWALEMRGLEFAFGIRPRSLVWAHHRAFDVGVAAMTSGIWWIVTAAFSAMFIRPLRFVFAPLLDRIKRRHFAVLAAIGTVVAACGAVLVWQWRA